MRAFVCFLSALFASAVSAENVRLTAELSAGAHDRGNTPVSFTVVLPKSMDDARVAILRDTGGRTMRGQLTPPSLLSAAAVAPEGKIVREVHFLAPPMKASTVLTIDVTIDDSFVGAAADSFGWHDTKGKHAELRFSEKPVMRYMYERIETDKAKRELTFKVFHHVFSPNGSVIITKGPGGKFTHHRGLFYGFNKVTYGQGKTADVWHCTGDAHQSHDELVSQDVGSVLGRHRVKIGWHGQGKAVFASEEREMTAFNTQHGTLIEFASRLTPVIAPVKLDGDPQHAGFHFRADNEVADKTSGLTYYLRPDGKGEMGKTRQGAEQIWNVMSFVLGEKRYTAVYLDHTANPKPAKYSEREYGRFGSYFVHELTAGKTLDVKYRVWIQEGELDAARAEALSADLVSPPTVRVK